MLNFFKPNAHYARRSETCPLARAIADRFVRVCDTLATFTSEKPVSDLLVSK